VESFQAYLNFYDNLKEENEHKEIAHYYKSKFKAKSFFEIVKGYRSCRSVVENKRPLDYNEELLSLLLECNEYVSNEECGTTYYLAPYNLALFFKKYGNMEKFNRLINEALSMAKLTGNIEGIKKCKREMILKR
jgi:hypothetical protein